MSKILILKTGNTVQSLMETGENFEHWFVQGCELQQNQYEVVAVFEGASLPEPARYRGIIVTGSPAYVTDAESWSENSADFLRQAVAGNIPILGVCYGHQLLAHALGGKVDFHPLGREIGTVSIQLNSEGQKDRLLGSLPTRFTAQVSHSQTVTELPEGAKLLASNEFESHHAFRAGENAWGVQFHPEFSAQTIRAYIEERREELMSEQIDPIQLLLDSRPTEHAAGLLKRFVKLAFD